MRKRVDLVEAEFGDDPILRNKREGLRNLTEIGITEGYGNFSNSRNMNRP